MLVGLGGTTIGKHRPVVLGGTVLRLAGLVGSIHAPIGLVGSILELVGLVVLGWVSSSTTKIGMSSSGT